VRVVPIVAALAFLVPAASAAPEGTVSRGFVRVDGLTRTYRLFVPSRPKRLSPVVLVFHGAGGTGESIARSTGFDAQADRARFIAVYLDGVGRTWNAGPCCGAAQRLNVNDIGFVSRLLDKLALQYRLDRRRIYVTGMSNGGLFSYAVACALPGRIAAAASVAGTLVSQCAPSSPVSILHVHGLADPRIPIAGGYGTGRAGLEWPPVQAGIDRWRALDGCPADGATTLNAVISTTVWAPCDRGTEVRLVTIAGAGHVWPRTPYDATVQIWQFFAAHPRR
jgi:polyhydroxybutyrate depolymerase